MKLWLRDALQGDCCPVRTVIIKTHHGQSDHLETCKTDHQLQSDSEVDSSLQPKADGTNLLIRLVHQHQHLHKQAFGLGDHIA